MRNALIVLALLLSPVAHAQELSWDEARYLGLLEQADAQYEQASQLAEGRTAALTESLRLREEATDLLRAGLGSGELDAFGDAPRRDFANLHQNVIALLLQLDRCEEAQARLDAALGEATLMPPEAAGELSALEASVGRCRERTGTAPPVVEVVPSPEPVVPAPVIVQANDHPAQWILLGTGGALLLSGLLLDLSLGDERSAFEEIQSSCRSGCTQAEYEEGLGRQDHLDDAKVLTGVLYGVGFAAAVTGVVLLLLEDDEPESAVAPVVGPTGVGAAVRLRF